MSLQTAADIPIQVTSETAGSERRISPSWTIGQLKAKLELITGIPPLSQKLELNRPGENSIPIQAVDEERTQLANFPLVPYAEIYVSPDALPFGQRSTKIFNSVYLKHAMIPSSLDVREAKYIPNPRVLGRVSLFDGCCKICRGKPGRGYASRMSMNELPCSGPLEPRGERGTQTRAGGNPVGFFPPDPVQ